MQTADQSIQNTYLENTATSDQNIFSQFLSWCDGQERHRFGWLGVILAIHGCFLAPVAMFLLYLAGMDIMLLSLVIGSMTMALITNLAAMPTKVTIPVFVLSLIIDLGVIGYCIAQLI